MKGKYLLASIAALAAWTGAWAQVLDMLFYAPPLPCCL